MFDVCGIGFFRREEERDVFIIHLDLDHLPLKDYIAGARMKFYVAPPIFQEVFRRYGEAFEVEEYSDILMVKGEYFYMGRTRGNYAFVYFIHDAVVIPECCNASELIEEYGLKYTFVFVFKQPRSHFSDFNNRRRDVFILDNSVWRPYAPNVIPKIVFAESDRKTFREHFAGRAKSGRII